MEQKKLTKADLRKVFLRSLTDAHGIHVRNVSGLR